MSKNKTSFCWLVLFFVIINLTGGLSISNKYAKGYTYNGACRTSCNNNWNVAKCGFTTGCFFSEEHLVIGDTIDKGSCSVGSNLRSCQPAIIFDSSCSDSNMKCKENTCNGLTALNGEDCKITVGISVPNSMDPSVAVCAGYNQLDGKWDASQGKCVQCSGNKENKNCGDGYGIHVNDITRQCQIGDNNGNTFEKACDITISNECDDKSEGSSCNPPAGGTCDDSGQCVAGALSLIVSPASGTIGVGQTVNINFFATRPGTLLPTGMVINTYGDGGASGTFSPTTCTTFMGTCSTTYTAPGSVGMVTISATANDIPTLPVYASIIATANISVINIEEWICDASGFVEKCSDGTIEICSDLDGAGPGCAGLWQNCNNGCMNNTSCRNSSGAVCGGTPPGSCINEYLACGCECIGGSGPCTPLTTCGGTPWSACGATVAGQRERSCSDGCTGTISETQLCCTSDADCFLTTPICDIANERCVQCLVNTDCGGTDVCNNKFCEGCKGEGEASPGENPLLCCSGLNLVAGVCTSGCDPNAAYFCNPARSTIETLVQGGEKMIGYILGIIGSIALLLIIIAGIMYITAAGAEEKITSAKKILTGAIIGLGIALLAFSLLEVVMTVLNM